jgi:hypothetical protein
MGGRSRNGESDAKFLELGHVLKLGDQILRKEVAGSLDVGKFECDEGNTGSEKR